MAEQNQETEVKFYIRNISSVMERLRSVGALVIQPRVHELNLRFDTPDRTFTRQGRVLRLRQDEMARLTYKDGTQFMEGALSRRELEFSVDDFDSAKQFIEALGYEVVFIYEKYRTTYAWNSTGFSFTGDGESFGSQIMLDELPYGNFIEIEGALSELKPIARDLGLKWDAAIPASYHSLFDRIAKSLNLTFRDLTFENFSHIHIDPADLGVLPAD